MQDEIFADSPVKVGWFSRKCATIDLATYTAVLAVGEAELTGKGLVLAPV